MPSRCFPRYFGTCFVYRLLEMFWLARSSVPSSGASCSSKSTYSDRLCRCYTTTTAAPEIQALQTLFASTGTWLQHTGWTTSGLASDPCNDHWFGVTCSNSLGINHVVALNLPANHLTGMLGREHQLDSALLFDPPVSVNPHVLMVYCCAGTLPTSITALSALTSLVLSNNALSASLPTGLSRLWTLQHLDVSNSSVTSVPDDLPTALRCV